MLQYSGLRPLGILAAMSMLGGCTSATQTAGRPPDPEHQQSTRIPDSPCDDPQYVELRGKALDTMTPREYEYFTRKDIECGEFRLHHGGNQATHETTPWPRASETAQDSVRVTPHVTGMSALRVAGIVALSVVATLVVIGIGIHTDPVTW